MRLDKFLWSVRLFKTRKLAADACRLGKVKVDEVVSKAGKEVKPQSVVDLKKDGITYTFYVIDLPPSRVGAPKVEDYISNQTKPEEMERKAFMQMASKLNRQKGLGRPTKKDRRDIDKLRD